MPHGHVPPLGHDPEDRMKIQFGVLYLLFVRSHSKFGIKIYEIDLMSFNDRFWVKHNLINRLQEIQNTVVNMQRIRTKA